MEIEKKDGLDSKGNPKQQGSEANANMKSSNSVEHDLTSSASKVDNESLKGEYKTLSELESKSYRELDHTIFTPQHKARMHEHTRQMHFKELEERLDWAISEITPDRVRSAQSLEQLPDSEITDQSKSRPPFQSSNSVIRLMQTLAGASVRTSYYYNLNNEVIALFLRNLEIGTYSSGTKSGHHFMSESLRNKLEIWRLEFISDPKLHEIVETGRQKKLKDIELMLDEILSGKVQIDMKQKNYDRQIERLKERMETEQSQGLDTSVTLRELKQFDFYKKRDLDHDPWDPEANHKKIEMFFTSVEDGTFQTGINLGFSDMSDVVKAKLEIWANELRPVPDPWVNAQHARNRQFRSIESMLHYLMHDVPALQLSIEKNQKSFEKSMKRKKDAKSLRKKSTDDDLTIEIFNTLVDRTLSDANTVSNAYVEIINKFISTIINGEFEAGTKAGLPDMPFSLKAKLDIWIRDFRPDS